MEKHNGLFRATGRVRVEDLLRVAAARWPDKTACVFDTHSLTYSELEGDANRLANTFIDCGIKPGDRIAVFLENRQETVITFFAILKAGAVAVMINPTTKSAKLSFLLNDCLVAALVLSGRSLGALKQTNSHPSSLRCIITCGPAVPTPGVTVPCIDLEDALRTHVAAGVPTGGIDQDPAVIIYTSGSTGRPKGVVLTHRNLLSVVTSISEYLGNVHEDIILSVLPLSFSYGLTQLLMSVDLGATLVLERSFAYPYEVVRHVVRENATAFPAVPTIFATLLQMKDIDTSTLDTVRYITNASAALPVPHIQRLRALFRNARIFSMYGQTECIRASYMFPEDLDRHPESVGRGIPNQTLWIVDEYGASMPAGQTGELVIRGSHVMAGYWGLPEETQHALRPGAYPWDHVLYTGDLFRMDDEGYLYFIARKDDIIKSRGEKISPREVESAIAEIPTVRDVAVVGVSDPLLGNAIKAVIVKADGASLTEREVIAHCAQTLEKHMVPKYVEFRDNLPLTTSGKVRRSDLC
jgi:amino acid adenylation domain-containing protein